MTHDDLIAVLLLLGVSPVDVAPEGCLNASSIFVVLLEDGIEDESHVCHMERALSEPFSQYRGNTRCCCALQGICEQFYSKMKQIHLQLRIKSTH